MRVLLVVLCMVMSLAHAQAGLFDVFDEPRTRYQAAAQDIVSRIERVLKIKIATLPTIDFERIPHDGQYTPSKNQIAISVRYAFCDVKDLFSGDYADKKPQCNGVYLRKRIAHEIGHHLVALAVRKHAPNGWLKVLANENAEYNRAQMHATEMISEGIATYIEYTLEDKRPRPYKDHQLQARMQFPQHVPGYVVRSVLEDYYAYGGFTVVMAALDENFEKGMQCIVENSFMVGTSDGFDFSEALAYRTHIERCVNETR